MKPTVFIIKLLIVFQFGLANAAVGANNISLVEVGVVSLPSVLGMDGKPAVGLGQADKMDKYHFNQKQYGFIRKGASVYFGEGCQEYNLRTKKISCELPNSLKDVFISPDGTKIFGLTEGEQGVLIDFSSDEHSSAGKLSEHVPGQRFRDPTGGYAAEDGDFGFAPTQIYKSLHVVNINTGRKKVYKIKGGAYSFLGFSGNGRYVFTEGRSIDLKTGNTFSIQYPTNYDLTLRYENSSPTESSGKATSSALYDMAHKKYIWKKDVDYGEALAFSWNSAFIITNKGYIVDAKTGEIAADGLKGTLGAIFSPDGYSFVTTDNKAFYIYKSTDPNSAIFGKYPGPSFTPNF